MNRDGYMDLVGPRTIFYNMGDNRFVASPQPGELTVKDLNGDGIPDYIYNDTEGKRVYTRTYLGGDRFEEQTLMKDLDVTNIHCYDFDKDGDVDILLTFDYLSSSTFSFLVFLFRGNRLPFLAIVIESSFQKYNEKDVRKKGGVRPWGGMV